LLLALFIAWYLGRHPECSVIFTTYGESLSSDVGRRVRNIMTSPVYATIFPQCRLSADYNSQQRFDTTEGGSAYFVGRGGTITGRGADLLICDDLLKDLEEAHSDIVRHGLHEWFGSVAFTRLTPDGAVVIVGTRWSEDDLTGWLLREHAAEGWQLLNLPALAEANDPLGRAEGEALWPERYDRDALESIRRQIGRAAFTALFQGHPAAASGALFKREWMRTYSGPLPSFQMLVLSTDTAAKTGKQNDYSVIQAWGRNNSGCYLLSQWRAKVEFPKLRYQLVSQAEQWKPHAILIEDAGPSGVSLIQELRSATPYPVLAVKVDRDKVARASAVTPMFEAGRVFLPADASWLNDFVDELAMFPNGVHDDMVDSATQALNYLRQGPYTEPSPFQIVERAGPAAQLRAVLNAPPARGFHDPRGFWEPRPILPMQGHDIPADIGKAIIDGVPLTPRQEDRLLFGFSLEDE
jgi:predicted phage terminase large subunit-like protein